MVWINRTYSNLVEKWNYSFVLISNLATIIFVDGLMLYLFDQKIIQKSPNDSNDRQFIRLSKSGSKLVAKMSAAK